MRTAIRTWWLLAVFGFEIASACLYFRSAVGGFHRQATIVLLGRLALATGACAIAAALRTHPRNWPLAVNGLAFGVLGLVLNGVFGFRIGFREISLLILITALSMAAVEWRQRCLLRRTQAAARVVLYDSAAVLLLLFGIVFAVIGVVGLRSAQGRNPELVLLGCYFALSAASVLILIWGSLKAESRT
jgi:uncharacterized membrane protein HdeD (DUF308 family)